MRTTSFSLSSKLTRVAWFLGVAGVTPACNSLQAPESHSGAVIYETCAPCHGAQGQGNPTYLAPAIAGLPSWYTALQLQNFQNGVRGAHPDDIGGLRMRPMSRTLRTKKSVDVIAAYLQQMKPTNPPTLLHGGDIKKGKATYRPCAACHGANGHGQKTSGAPNLTLMSDWYMATQIRHFKTGVRGVHPQDIRGQQMRAMTIAVEDDQAIKDVVAYIMTLK